MKMTDNKFTQMKSFDFKQFLVGNLIALGIIVVFVIWAQVSPATLGRNCYEDGLVEILTVIFLGLSCVGFLMGARRSKFLKSRDGKFQYFFMIAWAVLMFLFMGEEASWGQWYFHFETPEAVREINTQGEFNIHNLMKVQDGKAGWDTHRLLSIFMLMVGFLLPGISLLKKGKELVQKFAIPVLPLAYIGFFVGSIVYEKYYYNLLTDDAATEVRELLMAFGLLFFAVHAYFRPDELFRVKKNS